MQQYLQLLKDIKSKGTLKPPARENMPDSLSLFGYQMRFNLAEGFPIMTTKKVKFSNIVTELLWFLRGDTNIKFLNENGFTLWNEDAYNYYCKQIDKANEGIRNGTVKSSWSAFMPMSFEDFIKKVTTEPLSELDSDSDLPGYIFGDCGFQYGRVWRRWETNERSGEIGLGLFACVPGEIDQIKRVYNSLKNSPQGRRHIVSAIDPAHDDDLALYWCHNLFQFNCRPLTDGNKIHYLTEKYGCIPEFDKKEDNEKEWDLIPNYYLDCQFYQRSGDTFLGVPYNTSSYALLTHLFCKLLNMIPGDLIHTFGDVHIYDNHQEQVKEQLSRTPDKLPTLDLSSIDLLLNESSDFDHIINSLEISDFWLKGYNPQKAIKGKLSTGLK